MLFTDLLAGLGVRFDEVLFGGQDLLGSLGIGPGFGHGLISTALWIFSVALISALWACYVHRHW